MSRADAILAVMLRDPRRRKGWTANEIASDLQLKRSLISVTLPQMRYWGWLERIAFGRYVVANPAAAKERLSRRETMLPDGVQIVSGEGGRGGDWLSGARWVCPECGAAASVRLVGKGQVAFSSHGQCTRPREYVLSQLRRGRESKR